MRLDTIKQDTTVQVRFHERMSFSDHGIFREMLTKVRQAGAKSCVFDLSELVSVDSAGLGMLIIAHEAAQKEGWKLTLQKPQPQVMKLLELSSFDKILTITR